MPPVLSPDLADTVRGHLKHLRQSVHLEVRADDSPTGRELRQLVQEFAALSDQLSTEAIPMAAGAPPTLAIGVAGERPRIRFTGVPLGHEFSSFLLAVLHVGGHPPKETPEVLAAVRALAGPLHLETFYSLSCQNCPEVVQALNTLAAVNPQISHTALDGAVVPRLVESRQVMAVPSVFLNEQPLTQGRKTLAELVALLDGGQSQEARERALQEKPRFDVLVVGGGPAGAASALYAARKGLRVGVLAERFGGQTQDTLGIENLPSVAYTEGPKLSQDLRSQLQGVGVDLIEGLRASSLDARGHDLEVAVGSGLLRARSVILAPGARWRTLDVPGEAMYRNRGVAYCPHCDGPLFKGKRVAVVGGGNSGVEAAIDLAGLAREVVVLEFGPSLRADHVLQERLRALPNVRVFTHAHTQEVLGDGQRVIGLRYRNRDTQTDHVLDLEGVFVQIGLTPQTDWLRETVALNAHGEIVVDAHGQTSLPGVFGAGDATTTPYKQIVMAMGDGARAALAAFDFLIRLPQEA